MLLVLILIVSSLLNVALVFLLIRAARRLLMFDELWENIGDDLDEGIEFFEYILSRPVYANSPEINVMRKNVALLRERMVVHATNLQRREKKPELKSSNPPVVVG